MEIYTGLLYFVKPDQKNTAVPMLFFGDQPVISVIPETDDVRNDMLMFSSDQQTKKSVCIQGEIKEEDQYSYFSCSKIAGIAS